MYYGPHTGWILHKASQLPVIARETFCSIQISTIPVLCLVHISFPAISCLLWIHAQRPLPSNSVVARVILVFRRYDLTRRGPIFHPCHHGEQDVMLSVREAGYAVNIVSQETCLVRPSKIPGSIHVRRRRGAVSDRDVSDQIPC